MILYRCFAWLAGTAPADPDGALWFPRRFQGEGRHDNPDLYGCLYLSIDSVSAVIEQLTRFRTQRLSPSLLRRRGLPLALAELNLPEGAPLVDLDDPVVLRREQLRPSAVATRRRGLTQLQARRLFERHDRAAGLRWWSTYEALWTNVTLFDRAGPQLRLGPVRALTIGDPLVLEAADLLGLRVR